MDPTRDDGRALARAHRDLIVQRLPYFALGWLAVTVLWVLTLELESEARRLPGPLVLGFQIIALGTALLAVRRIRSTAGVIAVLLATAIALGASWVAFFVAYGGAAAEVGMIHAALCASVALTFALRWHVELVLLAGTLWVSMLADPWLTQLIPPLQTVAATAMGTVVITLIAEGAYQSFRKDFLQRASEAEIRRQLIASHDAYRDLAETTCDLIWTADLEGRFTYANEATCRFLGTTPAAAVGRRLDAFMTDHPANPDIAATLAEITRGDLVHGRLAEVVDHQAPERRHWHEVNLNPIRDERGAIVGVQGISRDVTERVRAQQALEASEGKFRSLAESMAVAVFIVQGTTLRYVNSAAIAMTGYTQDELLSMPFWNVMHPDDRARTRARGLARQRGLPVPNHAEYRIRTRDGNEAWVDFRATTMEVDGQPAMLGTAIDITERKRMATALSASERRYRSLVESQREVIARAAADDARTLTFVNDAFCEIFGRDRATLVGRSWMPLCHEDDEAIAAAAAAAALHPPYRVLIEWRVRTADGVRWYEWEIGGVRDAHGAVVEVQAVGRDVTARKEAEDGLRRSLAQLTRSEDKLRQLALGQVAIREEERKRLGLDLHDDVCQELVGIGILLEAVRRRIAPAAEAGADLGRATRYLNEVVEHLRALASDLRPLQLRDLGLVGSLRALAQGMSSAQANVDLRCSKPIPALEEETELALYRVAQESILNALRHGCARHVQMTVTAAGAWIRLEVYDDGRGLDGGNSDGRGLGLVSMEERALALGGRFRIASAPDAGTTMVFECPLLERSSAA